MLKKILKQYTYQDTLVSKVEDVQDRLFIKAVRHYAAISVD